MISDAELEEIEKRATVPAIEYGRLSDAHLEVLTEDVPRLVAELRSLRSMEAVQEAERHRAAYIAVDMDSWTVSEQGGNREMTLHEYAHAVARAIIGADLEKYPLESWKYSAPKIRSFVVALRKKE